MIFERSRTLLGDGAFRRLRDTGVAIFGLGGVGGWCAEALVRTGVRRLMLVDPDSVAASNVNRQVMATGSTIGEAKAAALARRLREISGDVALDLQPRRYDESSAGTFGLERFDYVIDAIDSLDCKALLIRETLALQRPTLLSSMGAARRFDPLRVRVSPFSKVAGDALARALRQRLRRAGGMPDRDFACVWSDEPAAPMPPGALGSLMQVTAAFGLALASQVVNAARGQCASGAGEARQC